MLFRYATAIVLATVLSTGCIDDECQPEESFCDGNVRHLCEVQNSDSHKMGNPYVWHILSCGENAVCVEGKDHYLSCQEDLIEPDPDKAHRWSTARASLGADSIEVTTESGTFDPGSRDVELSEETSDGTLYLTAAWVQEPYSLRLRLGFVMDGAYWVCTSIAFSDGTQLNDTWVTHPVPAVLALLGSWYRGDLLLPSTQDSPVAISIKGLQLRAFE